MDEFRGMCEWEVTVGDGVGRGPWGIMLSTYLHIMGNIFKTRVVLGLRYPLLYIVFRFFQKLFFEFMIRLKFLLSYSEMLPKQVME